MTFDPGDLYISNLVSRPTLMFSLVSVKKLLATLFDICSNQ